jgi:hypothetical protein
MLTARLEKIFNAVEMLPKDLSLSQQISVHGMTEEELEEIAKIESATVRQYVANGSSEEFTTVDITFGAGRGGSGGIRLLAFCLGHVLTSRSVCDDMNSDAKLCCENAAAQQI